MEPLFIEATLDFEKSAAEVTLPEDPNQWPTELLQELYKQVPYVSDFDPDVIMDRVDAERRYGFGHVEISNKTEIQESPESNVAQATGIRHVRIPIIIKEGKLQPFDVIVTDQSKMLPLTEKRLRQALFRPQVFDVTSRTPGDQSMISQLYPPYRQNYGFGGGGSVMTAGMGKEGSVLRAILPSINQFDYVRFAREMSSPLMKSAYASNQVGMREPLNTLMEYNAKDLVERKDKLAAAVRPTVLQYTHMGPGGYALKTANAMAWNPSVVLLDRGEVLRLLGDKALELDKCGSITMGEGQVDGDLPETDDPELVKDFGIYKVQDTQGRHLVGFCFPNLLDVDGSPLPLTLFTNGSQTAFQGEVVGVRIGDGVALIEGKPRGYGMFYKVLQTGKAVATIPLEIHATMRNEEEGDTVTLVGKTVMGNDVHVQVLPGLNSVTSSDETHMLVPDDWNWMPLDRSDEVVLVDKPESFDKLAAKADMEKMVEIRSGGSDSFSFSGPAVEKMAAEERSFLDLDSAMFLLAGLGLTPSYGIQKLAQALTSHSSIQAFASHTIEPLRLVQEEMMKKAMATLERLPDLRKNFIKEASAIPDPAAVDTILSLGFINPENILTFISFLPNLNETQEKLCELLIAARMGQQNIPAPALERTIRGLEETIEGLQTIAFQN